MTLIIGIDGGGTHTRAVLVDETLREYGRTEGPGGNPSGIGWDGTANILRQVIDDLLLGAGFTSSDVAAAGIGMAGAPATRHAEQLRQVLTPIVPGAKLALSADLEIALVGAHGRPEGMILVAGTGSGTWAISAAGKTVRAGGWGYLVGDEGSGFWIGSAGLRAVMRSSDGREAQTALTAKVLSALGLFSGPEEAIRWLYSGTAVIPGDVAALAPLVCEAAREGDAAAGEIIAAAVDELILLVEATLRRMEQDSAALALAGSLLTAPDSFLAERFTQTLIRRLPEICVVTPQYPPVIGAALLALDLIK